MTMYHTLAFFILVLTSSIMSTDASRFKGFNHDSYASTSNYSKDPAPKKWAILIAGSNVYHNYRHQADVCHAYQVLKKGGLKDENIVVFMYDDIAFHKENPRPGVIINKPNGEDVYNGVPKDYIGDDVNVNNFFAVLLGNKTALTGGGSGKVVDSGPNDHIFIYYADHGGPGMLGMPHESLYANDLIDVLKKKHEANSYRRMVIYIEACESGSMFEGLLPENLNVYVTTAANTTENSYGYYCPSDDPYVDIGYDVCLGDLYSVAWIEDSEKHDLNDVTLEQQYQAVRRRTAYEGLIWDDKSTSHVMQFGTKEFRNDSLVSYIGTNPANGDNATYFNIQQNNFMINSSFHTRGAGQRDANLLYYLHKIRTAPEGSQKKDEAKKLYDDEISSRLQVDQNMNKITNFLFGSKISLATMLQSSEERKGKPVVDDWECFKSLVRTYESNCGKLSIYGRKYMRVMANMCNAKIKPEQMTSVVAEACGSG